jgi:hypothetical protein
MRAQKRDQNEPAIVKALEDMGYRVQRHYTPDPFDLMVSRIRSPVGLRIEVKTKDGGLTDKQADELAEEGIVVVRTPEEALAAAARWL